MAASTEDTPGGYDVSFVAPLDKEYECPVCLHAVRDPVQTPCGHSFCKSCFDQVVNKGETVKCPLDKQHLSISEVFKDAKVKRLVLALKVRCTNKSSNNSSEVCQWIGELSYLQDHLTNECAYAIVECPRMCGQTMQRHEVSHHRLSTCDRVRLVCGSCKEEIDKQHLAKHNDSCPKRLIDCTLKCGNKMPRENMESHVSETGDCPNSIVPCVFKDSGCNVTIKRHEMGHHLTISVVQHQIQQQEMITRVHDENKQLREETKELKQKLSFHVFASSDETMWSSCGRVLIKFPAVNITSNKKLESSVFLAHHSGYRVTLNLFPSKTFRREAKYCFALRPAAGDHDDELRWPFPFRYTVTLIDQLQTGDDIKMTIDAATCDVSCQTWYCKPSGDRNLFRFSGQFWENMFRLHNSVLFSGKYVKNDNMVVAVELHDE